MLNNITIGRYHPGKSKIHLMNPTAKIISIILFVLISLFSNDILLNLIISIIVLLVIGLTHIPLKTFVKTIYGLRVLIVFIFLINFILKVELLLIGLMLLRLVTLVLYTSILTLTTTPNDIAYGLETIMWPFKKIIPVNQIALSISLSLRFIPTIIDQANRVLKALASRGVDYAHTSLKGKVEAVKALLLPLFILSFKRADTLSDVMEVRLYDNKVKRTNYHIDHWHLFDLYIVLMHILILIVIIVSGVK